MCVQVQCDLAASLFIISLLADFLSQYVTLFQSKDIVKNLVSL